MKSFSTTASLLTALCGIAAAPVALADEPTPAPAPAVDRFNTFDAFRDAPVKLRVRGDVAAYVTLSNTGDVVRLEPNTTLTLRDLPDTLVPTAVGVAVAARSTAALRAAIAEQVRDLASLDMGADEFVLALNPASFAIDAGGRFIRECGVERVCGNMTLPVRRACLAFGGGESTCAAGQRWYGPRADRGWDATFYADVVKFVEEKFKAAGTAPVTPE